MGTLKTNNVSFFGNPDAKTTIMFGHGFGLDQSSFDQLTELMAHKYRIIRYDMSGSANTSLDEFSPDRYQDLQGYVADLEEIINQLEVKPTAYLGHSVNGMIGLLTSIRNPSWFDKLVLLGASPRYLNDSAENYKGGFEQSDLDSLYDTMLNHYMSWVSGFSKLAMKNEDRPELAEAFASTLSKLRPDIAQFVAKSIFESDHRKDLPQAKVKTLILQTSNDIAVPVEVGTYLKKHIANSHLEKINTEGHFPQISAPGEIFTHVNSFVS